MKCDIELEQFLKSVDEIELRKKIRIFRRLNFQNMSEGDVFREVLKVLQHNGKFIYEPYLLFYPAGTNFYRVRVLEGHDIPNENLSKKGDFWAPPAEKVTAYNRLNKPQESLLYTSPSYPHVAINEMKNKVKDNLFVVIIYKSIAAVKINIIGLAFNHDQLGIYDEKAIRVGEMYNDFFHDEFSRDVGDGTEYLYKISECIAKTYFDLPPRDAQDAWAYPSVQNKSMLNVCFRPEIANELLELQPSVIGRYINQQSFAIVKIVNGFDDSGVPVYHDIDSEEQKRYWMERLNGGKS